MSSSSLPTLPGQCVQYSDIFIAGPSISNGSDMDTIIKKLRDYASSKLPGVPTTSTTSTTSTTGSTHSTTTTTTTRGSTTTTTTTTGVPTTSTTSTTTTSTTSSTTTTTTTAATTTTTTSTTSTTTSSTTTTTTTLNLIFFSSQASGTPPSTSGAVTAGSSTSQDASLDVVINWQPLTPTPLYCWVAIPDLGVNYEKNFWATVTQSGNIGTSDDLFGAPTQVVISGTIYNVYITNYPTKFTSNCTLSH